MSSTVAAPENLDRWRKATIRNKNERTIYICVSFPKALSRNPDILETYMPTLNNFKNRVTNDLVVFCNVV
jgi:hypothetical protein